MKLVYRWPFQAACVWLPDSPGRSSELEPLPSGFRRWLTPRSLVFSVGSTSRRLCITYSLRTDSRPVCRRRWICPIVAVESTHQLLTQRQAVGSWFDLDADRCFESLSEALQGYKSHWYKRFTSETMHFSH